MTRLVAYFVDFVWKSSQPSQPVSVICRTVVYRPVSYYDAADLHLNAVCGNCCPVVVKKS